MYPSRKPPLQETIILGLITIGIILFPLIPPQFVTAGPSLCIFRMLGIEKIFKVIGIFGGCPGCGITRAMWSLLRGNPVAAAAYNWRVLIVAPILVILYIRLAYFVIRGKRL